MEKAFVWPVENPKITQYFGNTEFANLELTMDQGTMV